MSGSIVRQPGVKLFLISPVVPKHFSRMTVNISPIMSIHIHGFELQITNVLDSLFACVRHELYNFITTRSQSMKTTSTFLYVM